MAIALLALFVALGGTSYSTLRIGGAQGSRGAAPVATAAQTGHSSFKDSFLLSTSASQFVTVARRDVREGRYVVVAKLFTGPPQLGGNDHVQCDLVAGADLDRVIVNHDPVTAFVSMSLNVVHRFSSPGTVRLRCGHLFAAGRTDLRFVRITAIRVEALSNVPSP